MENDMLQKAIDKLGQSIEVEAIQDIDQRLEKLQAQVTELENNYIAIKAVAIEYANDNAKKQELLTKFASISYTFKHLFNLIVAKIYGHKVL